MDDNSDQLELKKILVDLEDEHKHLQASIGHLEHEIRKRELDIQALLVERELELAKNEPDFEIVTSLESEHRTQSNKAVIDFSSEFAKQVSLLLTNISKTSEEISAHIKL